MQLKRVNTVPHVNALGTLTFSNGVLQESLLLPLQPEYHSWWLQEWCLQMIRSLTKLGKMLSPTKLYGSGLFRLDRQELQLECQVQIDQIWDLRK